jgi:hypothetical protein
MAVGFCADSLAFLNAFMISLMLCPSIKRVFQPKASNLGVIVITLVLKIILAK